MLYSDDSWHTFMKRFASSVEHITGQELDVHPASRGDSLVVVEQELEELRAKVEELSDEVGPSLPKFSKSHLYRSDSERTFGMN